MSISEVSGYCYVELHDLTAQEPASNETAANDTASDTAPEDLRTLVDQLRAEVSALRLIVDRDDKITRPASSALVPTLNVQPQHHSPTTGSSDESKWRIKYTSIRTDLSG